MLGNFSYVLSSAVCFSSKSSFLKKSFRNINRVSNSLDPDQARKSEPDLCPNSLQRLSADDTSKQSYVGVIFRKVESVKA